MRYITNGKSTIDRFLRDRSGSFAAMSGIAIAAVLMGAGFGVNLVQSYHVKSGLRSALDAAVTSTARDLTTGRIAPKDARPLVEAFLAANSDGSFTETNSLTLETLVVDETAKTVEATASAHVDIAFPLFSNQSPRVVVDSAAVYSDRTIEVSMVLDVTGSMSGAKINNLKTAATNAVKTFLKGQDPKKPRVRVAIVPYSDAVNTGSLKDTVHVETKFTTGEPPKLDLVKSVSAVSPPDKCATERKGSQQFTDAGPDAAMVNRDYRLGFCPAAALRPLSADLDDLIATIDDFKAGGSTAGHIGIQWGWYMLSPEWNVVLPKASKAKAYDEKKSAKYAIIMTDGEFNTAFAGVNKTGDTHKQASLSRTSAESLCEEMRETGIEIFTIGFMLHEAGAKEVLQDCASPDVPSAQHYFETASEKELDAAFQKIAQNIERLALTR